MNLKKMKRGNWGKRIRKLVEMRSGNVQKMIIITFKDSYP